MVSNLETPIDLGATEYNAIIVEDINLAEVSETKKIKLYIPTLMPKIEQGDPKQTILPSKGSGLYSNQYGKPTVTSNVLYEQNYIECVNVGDLSVANMQDTINIIKQNLPKWISIEGEATAKFDTSKNTVNYTLKKGTVVRCAFLNGKISQLCIDINKNGINTSTPETSIK